jgi:RNA polymerase sigma-70 factor (ECF subfamily)
MSEPEVAASDPRMADADLIARCRAGEAEAWDALFDKYYPVAARFVFQLSADFNHEDTEEICQETFLAVVRNLASFQGKSSFQTWLLRVAANKALDFRGKSRAEKRGGSIVHFSLDGARESGQIDPPARCPGPDSVLVNAETFRLIRQSLDQLDDPCREIIELRYYGELSYSEIATELRLNPKTVSSRLSKCLDRLCVIAKKIFPPERSFAV